MESIIFTTWLAFYFILAFIILYSWHEHYHQQATQLTAVYILIPGVFQLYSAASVISKYGSASLQPAFNILEHIVAGFLGIIIAFVLFKNRPGARKWAIAYLVYNSMPFLTKLCVEFTYIKNDMKFDRMGLMILTVAIILLSQAPLAYLAWQEFHLSKPNDSANNNTASS